MGEKYVLFENKFIKQNRQDFDWKYSHRKINGLICDIHSNFGFEKITNFVVLFNTELFSTGSEECIGVACHIMP